MSAMTEQVGGDHYKGMAIQPVEFIHRNGLGFIEGCAIKYVVRHREKGGAADVRKAIHFLSAATGNTFTIAMKMPADATSYTIGSVAIGSNLYGTWGNPSNYTIPKGGVLSIAGSATNFTFVLVTAE